MKWLRWLVPAALGLALFLSPAGAQFRRDLPQKTKLQELTITRTFVDETPRAMVVIGGDHHGCGPWPLTVGAPLAAKWRIPYTPYISRSDDTVQNGCEDAEDLTSARLQTLFASPYIEVGVHAGGQHAAPAQYHASGRVTIDSGSSILHGTGTIFSAISAGDLIYIPAVENTPFIAITITDGITITLDRNGTANIKNQPFFSYDAFDITDTQVDGTPTPTAVVTCTACNFTAETFFVKAPVVGGTFGVGSMVIIDGAPANPYFVDSIDTATQITLNKTINIDLSNVALSVSPSIQLIMDDMEKGKFELETDGNCLGCVVSAGGPANGAWPESGYYLNQIGVGSFASQGGSWNMYGQGDGVNLIRFTGVDVKRSPQGWIEIMKAASETDGLLVINTEEISAGNGYYPADNNGTVAIVDDDNTIELLGDNCPADPCWADGVIRGSGGVCETADECYLFVRACVNESDVAGVNCQLDQRSFRISSFTDDNTLEVDPVDSPDIDMTPNEDVTNAVYWIDNVDLSRGSTPCSSVMVSGCTASLEQTWDNVFEWLNLNRDKVLAVTQSQAVKRFRTMSPQFGPAANLIMNPYRRIIDTASMPPDSGGYVASNGTIAGWKLEWVGTPDNTISVTFDQATRELVYTDDNSGARMVTSQGIYYTSLPGQLSMFHMVDMQDVTNIDTFAIRLDVTSTMNNAGGSSDSVGSVNMSNDDLTTDVTTDPTPVVVLRDTYTLTNFGLMRAMFDCTTETNCDGGSPGEASNVIAPGLLQAFSPLNASPDPFIMDASDALAGRYFVTTFPSSKGQAIAWVQSLTDDVNCTLDRQSGADRQIEIRCIDHAGTGTDTDFALFYYDPVLGANSETPELILQMDLTGTARFGSVAVFAGTIRQRS